MKINRLFIVYVFICILLMSIGYASLNTEFSISGEAFVSGNSEFRISNISIASNLNGAHETYNSFFSNTQTDLNISLPSQNSSITFHVEVTNDTSENYYLNNINELLNSNSNIRYEVINGESLFFEPNSISIIEIRFYYENSINSDMDLSLSLNYDFIVVPFEKLEYLVSSGNEYIDTGVMNTGDYIFESTYWFEPNLTKDGVWLFSGRKTTNYTLGVYMLNGGTIINSYGGSTMTYSGKYFYQKLWHELYYSRTKFTIDGYNVSVFGQALVPKEHEASILLGANIVNWDGGIDTRYFIGRIKYFKIVDATTGVMIRNFIPVKLDDTGEVCYWDTVTKEYYSNIGTGGFLEP